MAVIDKILLLLNGLPQEFDIKDDELQIGSVRFGGAAGTELTKAILDNLVSLQDGSEVGSSLHTHDDIYYTETELDAGQLDNRYYTESELGSNANGLGASLIGIEDANTQFTATTVEGALDEALDAAQAAQADIDAHVDGGANKHDATEIDYERSDGSKKNIQAGSDDVENALTDLDDAIGTLAQGSNYTAGDATEVASHLAGIDTALAGAGSDENVKVSANDTTAGYLEDKIVATSTNDNSSDALEITTLNDGGNEDLEINFDESKITIDSSQISDAGSANGVATLDGSGKIPSSQLTIAAMEFLGSWNASTNSPTLADSDSEAQGDVYRVTVAGTQDLGSGNITFGVGDWVYHDGTQWQKADNVDDVISVAGKTGAVTLDSGDITDFDEAAQDAVGGILVDSSTIDFTYDDGAGSITAIVIDNSIDENKLTTSVFDGDSISGGNGSAAVVQHAPSLKKTVTVDESFAADTSFLIRYAVSGETAGRVLKADSASAAANGEFYAVGIVAPGSALSAGQTVQATFIGSHTLASNDTNFNAGDIGLPVYLTDAGAFSITPPADSGDAVYRVGIVEDVDKIWLDAKQLNGIVA